MSKISQFDLIIVGAGPAGISTALHLEKLAPGLVGRTLILEKDRHPRPKVCGGGLLPDAEVILQQLGLDITEIPHVNIDRACFDFEDRGFRFRPDPRLPYAFRTIHRQEFDSWLALKARQRGFLIQEDTLVTNITVNDEAVFLATNHGEYQAEVVVGADGSNSVVRRAITPSEDLHVARLLEIITGPQAQISLHQQGNSYFNFVAVSRGIQGYVWDFPAARQGEPVRVWGIFDSNVFSTRDKAPLRVALSDELARHGLQISDFKMEGHPIRWFKAQSVFSAPRILLAGDAAGADALFGEGISIALGYGNLAAGAIRDAFTNNDFSFGGYAGSILHSEMGKALRRRTWWAGFFYRLRWPAFQRLVWHHLGPFIIWIMRGYLIGWAQRQIKKTRGSDTVPIQEGSSF
jgi:flavin-dependent dehydrogenase